MGHNVRYEAHFDALQDARIAERDARGKELQSLTPRELRLDREPVTIDPDPKPVKAWVRFNATPVRVPAWACQWTDRAVAVWFEIRGREYRAWVWKGAVEEDREPRAKPEALKNAKAPPRRPAGEAEGAGAR